MGVDAALLEAGNHGGATHRLTRTRTRTRTPTQPEPQPDPNSDPNQAAPRTTSCRPLRAPRCAAIRRRSGCATDPRLGLGSRTLTLTLTLTLTRTLTLTLTKAVLMGLAAHRSIDTGRPVLWSEMLDEFEAARAQYGEQQ